MKNIFLSLVALSASQVAMAGRILPMPAIGLEPVLVKSVVLEGDFMPPLPPGSTGRPLTTLTVQVDSNGCTNPEDFKVEVTPVPQGQRLSIIRVRRDVCRAFFPKGVELDIRVDNVNFGKLLIANPLRVEDRTTH